MFDFNSDTGLEAGQRGQQVIQDLLGGGAKLASTSALLDPAGLLTEVALRPRLAVEQNGVARVRQVHTPR